MLDVQLFLHSLPSFSQLTHSQLILHYIADSGHGKNKADKSVESTEGDFNVSHLSLPDQNMLGGQKHGCDEHGSEVNAAQIHFQRQQ